MLGLHRGAAGQAGQDLGIAVAGDHRPDHVLRGEGGQLAGHRRELDQRAFQQLFQPPAIAGPLVDEPGAHPGVIAQVPDRPAARTRRAVGPSRSAGPATARPACLLRTRK